ncbi:unnamed protein product [Cylicostephanus goldi]|uniref:Uncharacterized protein n=1 Tax=Cylicostephanus goldi TaxID=71465 RepID=A0A3P7N5Q6_CYLGO|nr:unnamed protein product [Cylicostephanus goldi]
MYDTELFSGPIDYYVDGKLYYWLNAISSFSISASAIGEEDVKFDVNNDLVDYANVSTWAFLETCKGRKRN